MWLEEENMGKIRNQFTSGGNDSASGKVEGIPNGKYVPSKGDLMN